MVELEKTEEQWLVSEQTAIVGSSEIGTQYHHSMEPQTVFCFPTDSGGLDMYMKRTYLSYNFLCVYSMKNSLF